MRTNRQFGEADREASFNTLRFLQTRLHDASVILWAARLGPDRGPERDAVQSVFSFPRQPIEEPFRTAWQHVLESWADGPGDDDGDMKPHDIQRRIEMGVDIGLVMPEIVSLVTPLLRLETSGLYLARVPRPPKTAHDLVYAELQCPRLVRLSDVGVTGVSDVALLAELTDRLEGALVRTLHRAVRLGPSAVQHANWVARVYHAPERPDEDEERDPDLYRNGFAPIARMFSEALDALADASPAAAQSRLGRLALLDWPLALRLWARAARRPDLVDGPDVGRWLAATSDEVFWGSSRYPEVAELRALRFGDLEADQRQALEVRLLARPPAALFNRKLDKTLRERLRDEAVTTELMRLQAAGQTLGSLSMDWLSNLGRAEALEGVDAGLYDTGHYDPPAAEAIYVLDEGPALLTRLERDLKGRLYVEGRQAMDYVSVNSDKIFELVSSQPDARSFPRIWVALASADRDHWIGVATGSPEAATLRPRAEALLAALDALPEGSLKAAIDGVSYWIDGVSRMFADDPRFSSLWLKLWPAAVSATNARPLPEAEVEAVIDVDIDGEDLASAALNSPAGRMVSAFLTLLPNLRTEGRPFADPTIARMRDGLMEATGKAERQVLFRLLQALGYMRRADADWADEHLIEPLLRRENRDLGLWEAISRIGVPPAETLAIIGPEMAFVAGQSSLPEGVRARLAERLVLPVLRAMDRGDTPAISLAQLEQMLRLGGDAVRISAASSLTRFLEPPSSAAGASGASATAFDPAERYRKTVREVLNKAWPKDRSAQSPGLSKRFARLPAAADKAFSEAVEDVLPLLVPFKAWSLLDYRLYKLDGGEARSLVLPRTGKEASALLQLLDQTIGEADGDVAPRDLDRALQRMHSLKPTITRERAFKRLQSLTRR